MDFLQLLISGVSNGCIYGLIALGFVMIYKASEAVNFAQGDLMMAGAFITLELTNPDRMGLPFIPAVLIAVIITGAVAYLLEVAVIRRLFGQPQFAIVILTIALGFFLRFLAGVIWGHEPLTLSTPYAGVSFEVGGVIFGAEDIAAIAATLLLTGALYLFCSKTKLGIAMQAASQNQMAAYYMGIPIKRINGLVWGLSGAVATVAGILLASRGSIDPSIGFLGIKAFAAAVIGGFGSLPGAIVGGLIVGISEPFAARYIEAGVSQIAPYAIMLLILVTRPSGLFSQVYSKKV